ncbi:hypothetical protein M407DRAFT_246098 [Tulasnella calospora MUT 4182]|uniref:Uncharacterized protein n=1 Tax=Tulasnella calospora MUT 4182 TaxID=1051891 RepID=A0A0C3Q7S4_9AGAM|nr:hypothetical protein M407DRAFT_246098 [Tulasnella calospora MUT 4182]
MARIPKGPAPKPRVCVCDGPVPAATCACSSTVPEFRIDHYWQPCETRPAKWT